MLIKFIYFDVGEVLVNTKESFTKIGQLINKTAEEIDKDFYRTVAEKFDTGQLTTEQVNQLALDFYPQFPRNYDFVTNFYQNFGFITATHDLVKLAAKKYQVGLLTNISEAVFNGCWQRESIPHVNYSAIIKSYEEEVLKPDKKIYEIAQEKAKVLPAEIFFIDNNRHNVASAGELGWQIYLFNPDKVEDSVLELKNLLDV